MKTDNLNQPGEFSHAKVRGHIGRRAGTPGPTVYDTNGNEVSSPDITFIGADVTGDSEVAFVNIKATSQSATNDSGGDLGAGDVVVLQSDGSVTTTTTPQDTRPVGVVLVGGADGFSVTVAFSGFVDRVNCTASVTAGHYGETSSTAGSATQNSTRHAGSFCLFFDSSATPSAYLFGVPTGGTALASDVTFDSTGLANTDATDVQEAIEDLDAAIGGGGGLVLVEQHTASSSAQLDFTSFYSTDYDEYLIEPGSPEWEKVKIRSEKALAKYQERFNRFAKAEVMARHGQIESLEPPKAPKKSKTKA